MNDDAKVKALAPWFGSNRILAREVGAELSGCEWVGIPFAGGMAELLHIDARTMLVNDRHRHVINLARVVADRPSFASMKAIVRSKLVHPDALADAQIACMLREQTPNRMDDPIQWAGDYFICCWMARSGKAGTADEFDTGMSIRYEAGGGDSAVRYRSAIRGLRVWHRIFQRCTFTVDDAFDMLAKCAKQDKEGHGLYCDPPFPGPGDAYKHNCGDTADAQMRWHGYLSGALETFKNTRVVCRFYDVPLIRALYPEGDNWTWRRLKGRDQTNAAKPEVLIINGPSKSAGLFT